MPFKKIWNQIKRRLDHHGWTCSRGKIAFLCYQGIESMRFSLMGFLKDWNAGISDIEFPMDGLVRKMPRDIKFLGPSVVWMVFYTEEEVAEFLQYESGSNKSMFLVLKGWMKVIQVIRSPSRETWIRFRGCTSGEKKLFLSLEIVWVPQYRWILLRLGRRCFSLAG